MVSFLDGRLAGRRDGGGEQMQTVNFRCGHCNNLMAVGLASLGQQVRCPTCQNVVVAPPSAPAPAPAPVAPQPENFFPRIAESEDIFTSSTQATDSLFDEPAHPLVEMPPSPLVTPDHTQTSGAMPDPAAFPEPAVVQHPDPHEGYSHTAPYSPGAGVFPPSHASTPAETSSGAWMASASENGRAAAGPVSAAPKKPREPRAAKINWFIPLVFVPLLLYAALATVAVAILYARMASAKPSMFDQMPDSQGDTPGVRPNKTTGRVNFLIDENMAKARLPDHLKVALGSSLVVGDLEVTPTGLERGRFNTFAEGSEEPATTDYEAIKLRLRLKNLAKDYAFTPLDNYFDRKWEAGKDSVPLTLLQAGSRTFFGGPADWFPLNRDKNKGMRREWVEGRKNIDREGLAPGETVETFVCTDGRNPAVQLLLFGLDPEGDAKQKPYSGGLLWRVQLRRGLITHKGRRLPATCVIGVEFTSADLPAAPPRRDS